MPKGPMTAEHKKNISEALKRRAEKKKKHEQNYGLRRKSHTSNTTKTFRYSNHKEKSITFTLPTNPHRIKRIIELGTLMDSMFPKTKVSQITEILNSVKLIINRGERE